MKELKHQECIIKEGNQTCRMLPVYKIKGKLYFRDERLGEYRNVKNPSDKISINSFPKLEIPTDKDKEKLFKEETKKLYRVIN